MPVGNNRRQFYILAFIQMYFDEFLNDRESFSFKTTSKIKSIFVKCYKCFLEIKVNSPELEHCLKTLYSAMEVNACLHNIELSPSVNYCLFNEDGKYVIARNGKLAYSFDNIVNVVPWFDWMVMTDLVDYNRHLTAVHAGALVKEGQTLIIVGKSGSGKSTLTMMMCLNGWKFVTDEVTIFSDNGINGIPRAFCLADNLAERLFGKENKFIKGIKRDKNYVYINPNQINIEFSENQAPVTRIIFPEKSNNEDKIAPIPLSQVMFELTNSLFDNCCYFENKLDTLINNIGNVSAAKVSWCDVNQSIKDIEKFFG